MTPLASPWYATVISKCAEARANCHVSSSRSTRIRSMGTTASAHQGATHGKQPPTMRTHTRLLGSIVVVHNGIIENYLELKHRLQAAGHRFTTETDTEVVAHLVEQEWNGDGLEGAVRRALRSIRGVFGLVFVCADDPGKIVAVREGPPIVVGIGDGEFLVASDIPPILRYTRDIVALEDGEMAVLRRRTVEFLRRDGRP